MRSVSGPPPIAEPQFEARTILRYSDNRSRPGGKLRLQLRLERWPQYGDIYSGVFAATRKFRVRTIFVRLSAWLYTLNHIYRAEKIMGTGITERSPSFLFSSSLLLFFPPSSL